MAESPSLKGHLLIATPALVDPNFHRSVVLILEHTAEGALGVVLNRPSGVSAADAVPDLEGVVADDDEVFVGGPVQPQAVIALAEYSDVPEGEDARLVGPIAPIDMGEDIDEMLEGVARVRLFAGYAGWSEGQLDGELDEEAWFTEPALPGDVFSDDSSTLWNRVLKRKGSRYRLVASMPEDPNLN
jgi:putative transcriptional regulator